MTVEDLPGGLKIELELELETNNESPDIGNDNLGDSSSLYAVTHGPPPAKNSNRVSDTSGHDLNGEGSPLEGVIDSSLRVPAV